MKNKLLLFVFFTVISFLGQSQVNLSNGLVAYYKFDGNVADSSSNGLNGSNNGASYDTGHFGKLNGALEFDGSNDYITVTHNNKLNLAGEKSISLWYKLPSASGLTLYPSLVYKYGITDYPTFGIFFSEDIAYGSNRHKIAFIQGNSITNEQVFTKEKYPSFLNQWVHITGTYSYADSTMRIYFNGKLSNTLTVANYTSNTSTDDLQIGRGNKANFSGTYFKGSLDDIRIYDRPLSQAEVSAIYNERLYVYNTINDTICSGDSILIQGKYRTQEDSFRDTINIAERCDSITINQLHVNPSYLTSIKLEICDGDKIFIAGKLRTKAGTYYDSLKTFKGCDSIIKTELMIKSSYFMPIAVEICDGDSYVLGSKTYSSSGTYYDSLLTSEGCDSIVALTLLVNNTYTIQTSKQICFGDSILLGGLYRTSSGTYFDSLKSAKSCDSIIITVLTVNPVYNNIRTETICQGDSLFVGGTYQTSSGSYTDVLFSSKGCDSIIITQLTVLPSYMVNTSKTICAGDSMLIAGNFRYTAGTYYENLKTQKGCDSIIATNLKVNPRYTIPSLITICDGDSALIFGTYRKTAGIFYDSLKTSNGCDSVLATRLIINSLSPVVVQNANVLVAQEGNASYQWLDCNKNNSPISGETSQLFIAATNGDYAVEITKNSCTVISNCISVIGLSTKNNTLKHSLKVYPNPAKGRVNIDLNKNYSSVKITLYTLKGKVISTEILTDISGTTIETNSIEAGIYLLEVIGDNERTYTKLIIE